MGRAEGKGIWGWSGTVCYSLVSVDRLGFLFVLRLESQPQEARQVFGHLALPLPW